MKTNSFQWKMVTGYQTIWIEDQVSRFVGPDLDPYCLKRSFKINIVSESVRKCFYFVQELLEGTVIMCPLQVRALQWDLTLCMLGNFFKYFFLSKDAKKHCFLPNIVLIYNLNVKQFGSQMKPHILWGFIWVQIICIGYQRSSKFTASRLRVK